MSIERRSLVGRRLLSERRVEAVPAPPNRRDNLERRTVSDRRRRTLLAGKIIFNDRQSTLNCTVRNLSRSGARLVFGVIPACPDGFILELSDERRANCKVAYRDGLTLGVHFVG